MALGDFQPEGLVGLRMNVFPASFLPALLDCEASAWECAFTPSRMPPARIPDSYCSTRESGMPQSISIPTRPMTTPAAADAASEMATGPATIPRPGISNTPTAATIGAIVPIVPPTGPPCLSLAALCVSAAAAFSSSSVDPGTSVVGTSVRNSRRRTSSDMTTLIALLS